jgi:uncharacterized protein YfaT (DUF1175 family)
MFAQLTRRRIGFTVSVGFLIVLIVSCFSLGRTFKTSLNPSSAIHLPKAPQSKDGSAPRKLDASLAADMDQDGLPDAAELSTFMDRQNFRRWFTGIAEMQFYRLSDRWNVDQRDCAGLARFAWREALKPHDRFWYQKMGPGYEEIAPDVNGHGAGPNPLGERLFRTNFGSYHDGDLASGKFSEFADARTLKTFNCDFISRNRQEAQSGDLLFFYQPWVQKFPYHVMIFLGQARIAGDGNDDWVVYHTGSSPTDEGTVKKVRLSVLDHHPNKRWRPVESNRNFLGFYRLKILE